MEKMSKKYLAPPGQYAVPTGWYYERSRKKYQQEQIKLSKDSQKRFVSKFPKSQIITKEQLAMYLTAVFDLRPDIVSRGKNWTMKAFGGKISETYRKNKEAFNEFYFKKCICAAIIYRTVDNYLETNKDSARNPTGFWYKTGGYKLNIVPYSIAKIMSSIPEGFTIDWGRIWERQSLSSAFMHEIEIVTKMTNDYICNSNGIIVTEYCKKESTWTRYRDDIKYVLSSDFCNELIRISEVKEKEQGARKEKREENNLVDIMQIVRRGPDYLRKLVSIARQNNMSVSYQELTAIEQLIKIAESGNVPITPAGKTPPRVIRAIEISCGLEEKLITEGLLS